MTISNGAVIGASVIEHSKNKFGDELITIQTKAPKYLDAECITGDTLLHFERMQNDNTMCLATMPVSEFYDKWTNGISKEFPKIRKNTFDAINNLKDVIVSRSEASRLLGKYDDFVSNFIRNHGLVDVGDTIIGNDFIELIRKMTTETYISNTDYKSVLSNMRLRAIEINADKKITTNVFDVWQSGIKKVFKVKTTAGEITTSGNHLFLTDNGWKPCKDLDIDNDLLVMISHKGNRVIPHNYLSYNRKIKPTVLYEQNYQCASCGTDIDKTCDIHHIVPVSKDFSLAFDRDNVEALCTKCHSLKHSDMGHSSTRPGMYKIESIEYVGEEMTYDLQVTHKDSNFVANGFVVHNCEKHRMISSNSSSDRAIPFNKLKSRGKFIPNDVRLNEKGMQGYENVSSEQLVAFKASLNTLHGVICDTLTPHSKIHKQHLNRYLIAFTMQDKVMTANRDQWDYFLGLRLGTDADPAIQELSKCIDSAINGSVARLPQESLIHPNIPYHLPYITCADVMLYNDGHITLADLIKISCARCARVSYLTHDSKTTKLEDDIELYNFLFESKHLTPMEHVALEMPEYEYRARQDATQLLISHGLPIKLAEYSMYSGNFRGFIQHRNEILYRS